LSVLKHSSVNRGLRGSDTSVYFHTSLSKPGSPLKLDISRRRFGSSKDEL
jgi:hypothetical protein